MVFAADDQVRASAHTLPARVVVRIVGIPEQAEHFGRAGIGRDRVRPVRGDLRVQQHAIVDGNVGGHEYLRRADGGAFGLHATRFVLVNADDAGLFDQLHAMSDRLGEQRIEIRRRMDLALVVLPVSPLAIRSRSITTTRLPARLSSTAAVSPEIPPPTIATSVVRGPASAGKRGRSKVARQSDSVMPFERCRNCAQIARRRWQFLQHLSWRGESGCFP